MYIHSKMKKFPDLPGDADDRMHALLTQKPKPIDPWPQQIRMSGLPFMLQGWNNVYYKTSDISDGCPVYRLDSYNLYWLISIIGVRIMRIDGVWVIWRNGDYGPIDIKKYGQSPQPDPFGSWSNGAKVKAV